MTDPADNSEDSWGEPPYKNAFLMEHKAEYVKKPKHYSKQDKKQCIICSIISGDEETTSFVIYKSEHSMVFLNLYPYTNFHLLISPLRHITGYEEMTSVELTEFSQLFQRCIKMLKEAAHTESFNAGWNQGEWSGGSIKHFHAHLVPRYRTDINFIDIIGKSRTVLQSLESAQQDLIKYQDYLGGKVSLDEV